MNNLNKNDSHLQKRMTTLPPASNQSMPDSSPTGDEQLLRLKSEDLFAGRREIEIEHQGRIYRLRLTSLNKLILTA